ncbi:MAG TPA: sulfur carrier protein ThiS [Jatrophihabitans sp.]|uniref:sulfur carrier protein ThiS n=1 Tax=Jatrophihabitans sp. TaxID=1932789 RepID=UPI002DF868A7|nr:sulfur carrier protein ThiS [Jatrophihabitans sp.]
MRIELNGQAREISSGTTVGALLLAETGSARGSAAVVDGEVVPRSTWDSHELRDGQVVELITAVQGG